MEHKTVVNTPEVTPPVPPVETPEVPEATPEVPQTPAAPGSKTDSELLLQSLKDEREKRRLLEVELAEARKTSIPPALPDGEFSDEGKAIISFFNEKHVQPLTSQVQSLTEQLATEKLLAVYPALKDKLSEFNEFRRSRSGYSLEDAAKLFMSETGMTPAAPKRKGLEHPVGGDRTPTPQGMTKEDIENLRKNNYNQYIKLLKEGKIVIPS